MTHEGHTNSVNPDDTKMLKKLHDPSEAKLPPFLPNNKRMREIWAHSYDLLSVFDLEVGKIIQELKEDGLFENTIIFVFSDHGTGLPGHKRWLNNAGLQVPFILYVPEKYKKWVENFSSHRTNQLVGFVDFAPTVLSLAGVKIPEMMQGRSFLGIESEPKKYIFGYRDRADDCYDMSRSVYDGRYVYVRHFMPQLPYFQNAIIFSAQKGGSYEEIHRLKKAGELPNATAALFNHKPVEELFDLRSDPFEQNNLAGKPRLLEIKNELRRQLFQNLLKHYDTGFLNEGEYMQQAKNNDISVFEMVRNYAEDDFKNIIEAAQLSGKIENARELIPYLKSDDSAIRYWAAIAADAFPGDLSAVLPALEKLLVDESPSTAAIAAEILVKRYNNPTGLKTLEKILHHDFEPVVLQAAISLRRVKEKAAPLVPAIQNEIMPKYAGDIWGRYKSWSYPMFIGMALDQTLINCGIDVNVK